MENQKEFEELFPIMSNKDLSIRFNISIRTIIRNARSYGLVKDKKYIARITKERLSKRKPLKGEKHPNWKGGKPWERFKDPEYIQWRNFVLERDKYICQKCNKQCKKYEKGLAAHHIKGYAVYPELRLDINNGLTLCRICHMEHHGRKPTNKTPIACACGCGTMIAPYDVYGRSRKYVNHHSSKGKPKPESMKKLLSLKNKGKILTEEHKSKIALGLLISSKRIGRPPSMKV